MSRNFGIVRAGERSVMIPGEAEVHGDFPHTSAPLPDDDPDHDANWDFIKLIALAVGGALLIFAGLLFFTLVTFARDLGQWDRSDPIVQWYSQLKQPDNPAISCCGESDAYWADEAETKCDAARKNCQVIATVTDDRDDDKLKRMHVPVGTKYVIPPEKIARKDGNPTGHVILFLGAVTWNGNNFNAADRKVLCFVMNGGV